MSGVNRGKCAYCSASFRPKYAEQRFCSPQHRRAAGRQRRAGNKLDPAGLIEHTSRALMELILERAGQLQGVLGRDQSDVEDDLVNALQDRFEEFWKEEAA